jgi:N-acetylglucosamine kinase-like BadF-type ATPase
LNYYLGVDGGGSKTYVLIADETGRIAGKGVAGNGNHQTCYEEAKANIRMSVGAALAEARLTPEQIAFAMFGLAGADRETDFRILRPMIAELGFPRHDIVCDTMIALRAGTANPYGVVLICGTGTNSAGRNVSGDVYQCGGFSYLFGDFGGGGALCVEAFRSVIRAWDGRGAPTILTDLVPADLGYDSVAQMFDDYLDHNLIPPPRLAELLFPAAEAGDETAQAILRKQGEELGLSASAVIHRLGMECETFDVVLAGSILTRGSGGFVIEPIRKALRQTAPLAKVVRLRTEPVVGAVWLAVEAAGSPLPPPVYDRLRDLSEFNRV